MRGIRISLGEMRKFLSEIPLNPRLHELLLMFLVEQSLPGTMLLGRKEHRELKRLVAENSTLTPFYQLQIAVWGLAMTVVERRYSQGHVRKRIAEEVNRM